MSARIRRTPLLALGTRSKLVYTLTVDLLYFVLLVSSLVFIHEFGHFLVAKFFGVKVLTFSVGFGPKLLRFRGRETEYCLGILPFGGFVKMLEESAHGAPILPEEKKRTFEAQAAYKRVLIVLAGPMMNILFPVLLYTTVFLGEQSFLAPVVGSVEPGKPAENKLMPGDRILAVDDTAVVTGPEVHALIAEKAGMPVKFLVNRDGRDLDVLVTPADEVEVLEPRELELQTHSGRIGISHHFAASVVGVAGADSPAWRAGLRTFDRITAINGRKVERFIDVVQLLSQNRGDTLLVTYLRPVMLPKGLGGLAAFAYFEPGVVQLTPLARDADVHLDDFVLRERDVRERVGLETSEMYAAFVPEGSSEWQAGMRLGDRVQTLNGVVYKRWKTLAAALRSRPEGTHQLTWTRDGETTAGAFQLRRESWTDEVGQVRENYEFRSKNWLPDAPDMWVPNPHPIMYALRRGVQETIKATQFIVVGFIRIAQGRVSLASVSGPIAMYELAGEAGARGATDFLWAVAIVSVNLGLVNLLPIPVLDGGLLAIMAIEGIGRRRLSLRVREVLSLVGIAMLAILMIIAFKNDLARRWDDYVAQVREIVG